MGEDVYFHLLSKWLYVPPCVLFLFPPTLSFPELIILGPTQ